jgi:hypothetical protein
MNDAAKMTHAVSNFVESSLLVGLQVADKLDRQSDWYGAGAGAALLLLMGEKFGLQIQDKAQFRSAMEFLAAS